MPDSSDDVIRRVDRPGLACCVCSQCTLQIVGERWPGLGDLRGLCSVLRDCQYS